jgi:hypothetical protein
MSDEKNTILQSHLRVKFSDRSYYSWDFDDTQTDLTIIGAAFTRDRTMRMRFRRWLASALVKLSLWIAG